MTRDDYIRLMVAAAGAVAWWLNQRKQSRTADQVKPHKETTFEDPDLAERTRRIREEIQRKIEQRAKAYRESAPAHSPTEAVPPVLAGGVNPRAELQPTPKAYAVRLEAQKHAEILEQQAALAEKLRQAAELKAAAARRIQFENQVAGEEVTKPVRGTVLSDDLRDPSALRRAFILREIVGPPVALR